MLKTITSSLPALHDEGYCVVDVKFETGQNPAMDAVANHLEDPNIFEQQQQQEFCDDDGEEVLQTPNSSPPQEAVNNKRKRSVPKKFSVDEDENPMHQVEKEALPLSTIFSPENGNSSIVKTESVDYSMHSYDDIAVPESNDHTTFRKVESWGDELAANAEIFKERELATKTNAIPRDDCPICGDKANGQHYGVYTCEGCKNFFKRSVMVTQRKPYICNNQNKCDVRIVIDMSGIRRKGARCQACRYAACLDAGMFHSGTPRSRGGRQSHSTSNLTTTTPLLKEFLNSGERADKRSRLSFEEQQQGIDSASWESMVQGVQDSPVKGSNNGQPNGFSGSIGYEDGKTVDSEEMLAKASEIFDTVLRDELEKEKSKNRELSTRLLEKEKQLKIAERQTESMKRHMVLSQGVAAEQCAEIKRLRNEINRLSVFRSTVHNYQEQNSEEQNCDEQEVIPSDMLAVSYNNE